MNIPDIAVPKVGEQAQDFTATDRNGYRVRLSDFRGKTVVLETGSLTCPIFAMVIGKLNDLARKFPNIVTLALYVSEAHHGAVPEHLGKAMESLPQCAERAKLDMDRDNRTIIIDYMNPTGTWTYERYPNMLYVINREGTIVYASDWMVRDLYAPHEVKALLTTLEGPPPAESKQPSSHSGFTETVKGGWMAFWK